MRLAIFLGILAFGFAGQSSAQDELIAPAPQVEEPAKPAQTRQRAAAPSKPRVARAPLSQCEEMTKAWVDIRPVQDLPTVDGLTTLEAQQASMAVCAEEQQRQPGNTRIAFVYARTLEVNGKGQRAIKLYEQLASAGYLPAKTQLARAYYIGNSVRRDVVGACTRYVEAARAGDAWAYSPAADCAYLYTSPPDFRRACQFYRQARASKTLEASTRSEAEYCQ